MLAVLRMFFILVQNIATKYCTIERLQLQDTLVFFSKTGIFTFSSSGLRGITSVHSHHLEIILSPRPPRLEIILSPHLDFLIPIFIPPPHLDIHTLTSPRLFDSCFHTLISPRHSYPHLTWLFVSFQHTLASPRLLNSLTLPNLTKPNLRSRAPNPAGASTHLYMKVCWLVLCVPELS